MFGRTKQQPEQYPAAMDGSYDDWASDAGQTTPEVISPEDMNIQQSDHWHVLDEGQRRPDGRNYYISNRPGKRQYYTLAEYAKAQGLSLDDLAEEAGHVEDPLLEDMRNMAYTKLGGQPGRQETDDDNFLIKIDKIEGLEIRGKGTLARLLMGDPAPVQPSALDQIFAQRMMEAQMPQSPYMAAAPYAPVHPYPEITERPYFHDHEDILDGTVLGDEDFDGDADEQPTDGYSDADSQDIATPVQAFEPAQAPETTLTQPAEVSKNHVPKKHRVARLVGALTLSTAVMVPGAYVSFGVLSWPLYGPEHILHKAKIIDDLNATMNSIFKPDGSGNK